MRAHAHIHNCLSLRLSAPPSLFFPPTPFPIPPRPPPRPPRPLSSSPPPAPSLPPPLFPPPSLSLYLQVGFFWVIACVQALFMVIYPITPPPLPLRSASTTISQLSAPTPPTPTPGPGPRRSRPSQDPLLEAGREGTGVKRHLFRTAVPHSRPCARLEPPPSRPCARWERIGRAGAGRSHLRDGGAAKFDRSALGPGPRRPSERGYVCLRAQMHWGYQLACARVCIYVRVCARVRGCARVYRYTGATSCGASGSDAKMEVRGEGGGWLYSGR